MNATKSIGTEPPTPVPSTAARVLRDHIAMAALTGLLANHQLPGSHEWIAQEAYLFADAMLVAREAT